MGAKTGEKEGKREENKEEDVAKRMTHSLDLKGDEGGEFSGRSNSQGASSCEKQVRLGHGI